MKKKLTNAYVSIFCAEMAVVYQSGIPLANGVLMLLEGAGKDGAAVLKPLLAVLEKGQPLSAALKSSGYFPSYMTGMTEVGEKSGRPTETMKALAEYYDRQDRIEAAVKNTVLYPLILLAMMVAVVLILITQVLPIFNDVFGRMGMRMSAPAVFLMQFGQWLSGAAAIIAGALAVLFIFAAILWLSPGLRAKAAAAVKKKWGGRGVFGEAASSHFVSAMALAMASGLDTKDALEMSSSLSGGAKSVDERNAECINLVIDGDALAEAMGKVGILASWEVQMLTLGAKGGMPDAAMAEIARRKERNLQDKIDRAVSRAEPALVITISVLVGVILLSVMLPLMGIMTAIG